MQSLGERIKKLRDENNLTQQQLGDIVELHGSNIGRIENGKVFPTSDILLKMADYFNVSTDYLLRGNNANLQIAEYSNEISHVTISTQESPIALRITEEIILIQSFRKLSPEGKKEIEEFLEYKLFKESQKQVKGKLSSSIPPENNSLIG